MVDVNEETIGEKDNDSPGAQEGRNIMSQVKIKSIDSGYFPRQYIMYC